MRTLRHAGFYTSTELLELKDYVWYDADDDGIHDPGELGVPIVKIELYDKNHKLIATAYTDSDGFYHIDDLYPGEYYIEFTPPKDYKGAEMVNGGSEMDPLTLVGPLFGLNLGVDDVKSTAGLIQDVAPPKLHVYTWLDMDIDGLRDIDESDFAAVEVKLYDDSREWELVVETDNAGEFTFHNLVESTYIVEFMLPNGGYQVTALDGQLLFEAQRDRTGDKDLESEELQVSVTLKSGDEPTIEAGFVEFVPFTLEIADEPSTLYRIFLPIIE